MATHSSRREALAAILSACPWLRAAMTPSDTDGPVRMAISETMLGDVNPNDARAAMHLWLKRIQSDLSVTIELSGKVFDSSEEILRGVRAGQFDAVALNIVEYRQIADFMDPSEMLVGAGQSGPDEYLLLVKRSSEFRQLANLRGRRLGVSRHPKMCAAPAWLLTLLDEEHLGPADEFFGAMVADAKVSRVVLPVFFGQTDACLTYRKGFEMMCELNPQVGRELTAIATSPSMVVCFYVFRKNYHNGGREKFIKLHSTLVSSAAGRQIATLFQFDELTVRDASCLSASLGVLERAEHIHTRLAAGGRKQ